MKRPTLLDPYIAFFVDRLDFGSPAQQLLDRFLIGYPRNGIFRAALKGRAVLISKSDGELIQKRIKEHGLRIGMNETGTLGNVVLDSSATLSVIERVPSGIPVFVYGSVNEDVLRTAQKRAVPLLSGTVMATALQVPALRPTAAREALVVVQGERPAAELAALDGLMPLLKNPKRVKAARLLEGAAVWAAAEKREWSWGLLRAALSRTDSPQGNAILDGRVEDMSAVVRDLAKAPRAWLLEHEDGLRTTILVLDGVVADKLVAMKTGGRVLSTQLFQAPSPMRDDFSRLAAVIEGFFVTGKAPWGRERMEVVMSGLKLMA